jgi:hypothetical protein
MTEKFGPIIVGGIGGSGTRVVARILQMLGVYMGSNLNETLDNLWFTLLMKRPDLRGADTTEPLSVFEKAMTIGLHGVATPDEDRIISDTIGMHIEGDVTFSGVRSLRHSVGTECEWWGWKEPCSSFWVKELASYFPSAHFVHVVRNGLDMCLSDTMKREFRHWGVQYGELTRVPDDRTYLRFWTKANQEAITTGKRLMGERFLTFEFEDLCQNPPKYVETLANIMGLGISDGRMAEICEPIHAPDTIGRGQHLGVSVHA